MYKSILLPVDLSDPHSWAGSLPAALGLLEKGGALHVLTVLPGPGMSMVGSYLEPGFFEDARQRAGTDLTAWVKDHVPESIEVHAHVLTGRVYVEIVQAAEKLGADLIVIASHTPELADFLIGPNAGKVVGHARCSVLVVRDQ